AKNESPCPIHPAIAALPLCAAAEWSVKCKASPRAAQMAGRCCLANSSTQKSVSLLNPVNQFGRVHPFSSCHLFFESCCFHKSRCLIQLKQSTESIEPSQLHFL